MKVSIIIPFHRGKQFLKDCLDSLLEQEFQDFEILLICDHYEGNVTAVIEPYKEKMDIRLFCLPENKTGVAAARNLGLGEAKGEFVYFLDSDDYLFDQTLTELVKAQEETGADFVYGRKVNSWFKRKVFLPEYREKLEQKLAEAEEEDDDEGKATSDFAGEAEDGENEHESDFVEHDYDSPEVIKDKRYRAARYRLFSHKGGLASITVLNMLIRRSFIEENNLRFVEEFKYYSDLGFLMKILDLGENFYRPEGARYIKRKHNDPIHNPQLSQMRDEHRFDEYVAAYYEAKKSIKKQPELHKYLDKKVVNYYSYFMATKLRRSKNDAWRNERYQKMNQIALGLDEGLLQELKGYRKRSIDALRKGKVKGSISVVNKYLAKKKLKRFFKRKNEFVRYMYEHYFLKMPLLENVILFESFFGKGYSDNPKYIYQYIQKNFPGKYKCVWSLEDTSTEVPFGAKKVRRYSLAYAYYLARANYLVFNVRQPAWFQKREGSTFLETWHGTPLKKLFFDMEEVHSAAPLNKQRVYNQCKEWDYFIAANKFSTEVFRSAFRYKGEMLEYGYPRNDIMHWENKDEIAEQIREKLNIPKDKKTILYAPTWRDDDYYAPGQYKFQLQLDLHKMKEELSDEYVVLLRTHYYIADQLDVTGLEDFAFNLSKYNDISELYLISDICITDYSSVFFDYANLKRPMLFFMYDLDKYKDVLRGFYIDLEEELPGPIVYTTEEIIETLRHMDEVNEQYAEKYAAFYEKYCGLEDGHASDNVVKKLLKLA